MKIQCSTMITPSYSPVALGGKPERKQCANVGATIITAINSDDKIVVCLLCAGKFKDANPHGYHYAQLSSDAVELVYHSHSPDLNRIFCSCLTKNGNKLFYAFQCEDGEWKAFACNKKSLKIAHPVAFKPNVIMCKQDNHLGNSEVYHKFQSGSFYERVAPK